MPIRPTFTRHLSRLMLLGLLCIVSFSLAQEPGATEDPIATQEVILTEEPAPTDEVILTEEPVATEDITPTATEYFEYTVRSGDTLSAIAVRFETTTRAIIELNGITNPNRIFVGQKLKIPGQAPVTPLPQATSTPAPTRTLAPTPTELPEGTASYRVRAGDTLATIAIRFKTTIAELVTLNNLANPNVIYVGQRLTLPAGTQIDITPEPTSLTGDTLSDTPVMTPMPITGANFAYGLMVFTQNQDTTALATQVQELGMNWVKIEVKWRDYEPIQGTVDFSSLDPAVDALNGVGINILMTVSAAPPWSRTSTSEDGPPDDFATFSTFMSALATHYTGKVTAYQIWNEPNLRREWNSSVYPLRADHYVNLLKVGYAAVKAVDPEIQVIAAGLAPTGFNDGVNAIDDRVYLQDMYSNGVYEASDALAVHPGGWANPPDATCCTPQSGVQSHFDSRTFYFKDTLIDYRAIMERNGDGRTLWITRFGWGTSEDTTAPGDAYSYVTFTSLAQQAVYLPRAYAIGAEMGFVGPMFLDNLNGCTSLTASPSIRPESCYTSLLAPDGAPRPAYQAAAAISK